MLQFVGRAQAYREEYIDSVVARCLEALGLADELRPGMRVVIKPNLIMAKRPEAAATTHPLVIRAVARWLRARGIDDITLAESSGGPYNAEYMRVVYRSCGMDALSDVLRLNDDFSAQTVDCPAGFANRSFHILTPIARADCVINLCKLKTHAMTGFSGGIKNLFGCIPGLEKPQMHYRWPEIEDFSNMLLELAQIIAPRVTLIDAVEAMEGNGPTGGTPVNLGLLLGSRDVCAQDCFAARLMGFEPREVAMLRLALERGLARPEAMRLVGDAPPEKLAPFRRPDAVSVDFIGLVPPFLQRAFSFAASHLLKSYPELIPQRCVGCGRCAQSCPAQLIRIANGKAVFRKKGCISCFCCQELCPQRAIRVKKAL